LFLPPNLKEAQMGKRLNFLVHPKKELGKALGRHKGIFGDPLRGPTLTPKERVFLRGIKAFPPYNT